MKEIYKLSTLLSVLLFVLCSFDHQKTPFNYDLHLIEIPGHTGRTIISFHGMGGSYKQGEFMKKALNINDEIVTFNFPDYNLVYPGFNKKQVAYGSIDELLPAIYVLKKVIIDQKREHIVLYGFSAGGGAIINVLATLNTHKQDKDLETIGVSEQDKKKILETIEKGLIILDAPLKSIDEIVAFRSNAPELEFFQKRYSVNEMEPIESLKHLKGLTLHFLIYFQNPDEMISNRDDEKYIQRLKAVNKDGTVQVIIGNEGGHLGPHYSLWKAYLKRDQEMRNPV